MAIDLYLATRRDADRDAMDDSDYGHSDDDGAASDTTSEGVVEVPADEIPDYFQERGGRLFHSHGGCPYPLPVDAEEQQRQNGLNALLRKLIGDHFVGPVREHLAFAPGEQRRVVDLGTGTGQWVLDMAREFPHVKFYGVDIVPIATRHPPDNVYFEMHNIMQPFRYATGSIDVVHARSITMGIHDYRALVREVARMLRHGGLFLSLEWGRYHIMDDGSDVAARAPRVKAFFDAIRETLRVRRGNEIDARSIPHYLENGPFSQIQARCFHAPIGDWPADATSRELGRQFREMMVLYARSMREVLLEGPFSARADMLVNGYIHDLFSVRGLGSLCFTVHARRI